MCSKFTTKTPEQRQFTHHEVLIINFEHMKLIDPFCNPFDIYLFKVVKKYTLLMCRVFQVSNKDTRMIALSWRLSFLTSNGYKAKY